MHLQPSQSNLAFIIGLYCLAILPNFWLFSNQDTNMIRNISVITLAVFLPIYFPALRKFPNRLDIKIVATIFILSAIIALVKSDSFFIGMIGFPTMPIGSLTIISSIWTGWSLTRLLDKHRLVNLIIFSSTLSLALATIQVIFLSQSSSSLRLVGFHEHSLAFAMSLGIGTLLSFWRFTHNHPNKLHYGLISILLLVGIGFSGSRIALLGTIIGVLGLCYFARSITWPIKKYLVLLILTVAIVIPFSVIPRLSNAGYAQDSLRYRGLLAKTGLDLVRQNPVGIGFGNIGRYTYSENLPSELLEPYHRQTLLESSHNLWIDITIGFGIIGGLLALGLSIYLLFFAWQRHLHGAQIVAVGLSFILFNFLTTPANITGLILLGVFIGFSLARDSSSAY